MNTNDVILHLLNMVIAEKEKNFKLQQQQMQDTKAIEEEKTDKD